MRRFKVGLLQGVFRSAFKETIPEVARVARPQAKMGPEDFRYNHGLLISLAREAAGKGANLVLGPESYLDGWSARLDLLQAVATTIPGPEVDELCATAEALGVWMCAGLFERKGRDIYNSVVLLSSGGRIEGIYRKTHETAGVLEDMPYTLGDAAAGIRDTLGGRWASWCATTDGTPRRWRTLRGKGGRGGSQPGLPLLRFSPYHPYSDIHRCVLRAHAYQNALFWISCNGANHGGHSLVVAPDGRLVAEASGEQEVPVVDLDPDAYGGYDFVSNLRVDLYAFPQRRGALSHWRCGCRGQYCGGLRPSCAATPWEEVVPASLPKGKEEGMARRIEIKLEKRGVRCASEATV